MEKISTLMYGMIFVMVLIAGFSLFISEGVTTYSGSQLDSFDNSSFEAIQSKSTSLTNNINQTSAALTGITAGGNLVDFVGYFFNAGYGALGTFVSGAELTNTVIDQAIMNTLGVTGAFATIVKGLFFSIILIIIIVVLLRVITKVEV